MDNGQPVAEEIIRVKITEGNKLHSSGLTFNIRESIVHENFNCTTFENDIAVLQLKSKIPLNLKIRAICLPRRDFVLNAESGIVVGYGSTDKNSQHSNALREVEIPIQKKNVCLDSDLSFFSNHLSEGNFCAGELNVQKGVCSGMFGILTACLIKLSCSNKGDSGNGFFIPHDNLWYIKGIVSMTKVNMNALNPTCNQESYALFTEVSHYLSMILFCKKNLFSS